MLLIVFNANEINQHAEQYWELFEDQEVAVGIHSLLCVVAMITLVLSFPKFSKRWSPYLV